MCALSQEFLCSDRVYRLQDTNASRPSITAAQESMANDATSVSGWRLLLSSEMTKGLYLTTLQRLLTRPVDSSSTS